MASASGWPRRTAALCLPGAAPGAAKSSRSVRSSNPIAQFPKSARLLKSSEFREVYDRGQRHACPSFVAFCLATNPGEAPRFGFTTPRALGKAVYRNRIRRRMREAVRLAGQELTGWRIVFNPRRRVLEVEFPRLQADVTAVLRRCHEFSRA